MAHCLPIQMKLEWSFNLSDYVIKDIQDSIIFLLTVQNLMSSIEIDCFIRPLKAYFFSVRRWESNLTDLAVQEFNFLITQMHEKIKNKIKKPSSRTSTGVRFFSSYIIYILSVITLNLLGHGN